METLICGVIFLLLEKSYTTWQDPRDIPEFFSSYSFVLFTVSKAIGLKKTNKFAGMIWIRLSMNLFFFLLF